MKKLLHLACLAPLIFAAGCGSLASHWRGGTGTYQGVRFDYGQIAHHSTESEFIAVADIPLSAIADTLFLPYDLTVEDKEKTESVDAPPVATAGTGRVGYK